MSNTTSRRNLLKNAAAAAGAIGGASALAATAAAEPVKGSKPLPLEKKSYPAPKPGEVKLFNSAVSYGNLLFLAGVGAHFPGTIEEHTKHVLDELEKKLVECGSSMEKVLKVSVFLNDLADYDRMNATYKGRFGGNPPVRTTVAPAGGIPGKSLVEIDVIAYI